MSTARPERRRQRAAHLTAKKKKVSLKSFCSTFNGLRVRWYRRLDPGQVCRRADVAQLVRLLHRIPPAALCPQSECPMCPLWASVGALPEAHLADRRDKRTKGWRLLLSSVHVEFLKNLIPRKRLPDVRARFSRPNPRLWGQSQWSEACLILPLSPFSDPDTFWYFPLSPGPFQGNVTKSSSSQHPSVWTEGFWRWKTFGSWKSFPAASSRFSLTRSDEPDLFVGLKLRCVRAAQLKTCKWFENVLCAQLWWSVRLLHSPSVP